MTNSKTTKRALFSSVVALLLCFTMLLGTTFAWFTDSAASGSNVITAGNLDIEVTYTLGDTDSDGEYIWKNLDGATDLFQKGLWEPGHTESVVLRIENKGSLAAKYEAQMNIVSETYGKNKDGNDIILSDILTVETAVLEEDANNNYMIGVNAAFSWEELDYLSDPVPFKSDRILNVAQRNAGVENAECTTLLSGSVHYVVVQVDMAETVGNEANHDGVNVPTINFGINVLATQYTYEKDSFGNQYDKDATYPEIIYVNDAGELKTAINDAADGATIYMNEGTYSITSQLTIDGKSLNIIGLGDVTLDLYTTRANYEKVFYIYGSKVEGNSGIDVTLSNIKITTSGVACKSDIWVRTWSGSCRGDVNLTLDNVNFATMIVDNNYSDSTVVNVDVINSEVTGKITLDASPFNNNGINTYVNLTYDNTSSINSIMIQNNINDEGMSHITINGVTVTARGEQLSK